MSALQVQTGFAKADDAFLVKRILEGEKILFEVLLQRYNQFLYRVIRSYVRDENDVEDLMQNTYLKAFDKLYQFKGDSSFSTWLIKIGINEALQRINNMKKAKTIFLNGINSSGEYASRFVNNNSPEKIVIHQEAGRMLEKAIDNLPEKYRVAYVMKEIQNLSVKEICDMLDEKESNVKVKIHRAKSLLKDTLLKLSVTAEVFEFGNKRCSAMVKGVMEKI